MCRQKQWRHAGDTYLEALTLHHIPTAYEVGSCDRWEAHGLVDPHLITSWTEGRLGQWLNLTAAGWNTEPPLAGFLSASCCLFVSSATPLYPSYYPSSLPVTQPIFHIIHLATLPLLRFAVLCLVAQSCPPLCNPMDCSQAPLSMGILQSGILEWDPPGGLPNPGIKPRSRGLLFLLLLVERWGEDHGKETEPLYSSKPTNKCSFSTDYVPSTAATAAENMPQTLSSA